MSQRVTAPVEFLIITALEEERDAVLSKLPGYTSPPPSDGDVRYYYAATVDATFSDGSTCCYRVALVSLANMGRVQAANTTSDAIRYWQPAYVMLVGIAGGLKSSKVNLGDILIADLIVDYEVQKVTKTGPEIRWTAFQVDARLLEFALNFPPERWRSAIKVERPVSGYPVRHRGTVATGDKVITVTQVLEGYKQQNWPKLVGVEMEAGGVAPTAHQSPLQPKFFMVRCVSDLLSNKNQKKLEGWRPYACDVAAAYAISLLKNGPVLRSAGSVGYAVAGREVLADEMANVTFAELQEVTKFLLDRQAKPGVDFTLLDPDEKMNRNGLTVATKDQLVMGLSKRP